MKIFDFKTQGDRKVYELPFMKIHLENDLCPNASNLLLTSQWVETEDDCRRLMRHLGQESGVGHLSGSSLILLLERVDNVLTSIVSRKLTNKESFDPRAYLFSFYEDFMKSELDWRRKRGTTDCEIHPDVFEQYPDLKSKIVEGILESIESGQVFAM